MVSTRAFVGRLNNQQAIRMVLGKPLKLRSGLQPRIGRSVKLDSSRIAIANAEDRQKAHEALHKWEHWIDLQSRIANSPKRLIMLSRQRELLNLLKEIGERRITAHQLAATLAFRYGIDKESLLDPLRKLMVVEQHRSQFVAWDGRVGSIYASVGLDLPNRIEKILAGRKRIVDSREIANALGMQWNKNNQNKINTALQLLNQMALVQKEPMHSADKQGRSISTWAHKVHGQLQILHPNLSLYVLEEVYKNKDNKAMTNQLFRSQKHFKGAAVGKFSDVAGMQAINKLQDIGLMVAKKRMKPSIKGKFGRVGYYELSLTPAGVRLMDQFYKLGRKSFPDLRRYLLGIK